MSRPTAQTGDRGEITRLLDQLVEGDGAQNRPVLDQLMPLVYGELKALARAHCYQWQGGPRMPGTASLVHEAYARLARQPGAGFANRHQFFSLASKVMRSVLVDNARRFKRQKRGAGAVALPLNEELLVSAERCDELLALDAALVVLAEQEPELARIVEFRFFGGLTAQETAETLEISHSTVKRRWRLARAWLYQELQAAPA